MYKPKIHYCFSCGKDISYVPIKSERHHNYCHACWTRHRETYQPKIYHRKSTKIQQWDIIKRRKREREKYLIDFNLGIV